jgi:hypothetical protein
MAAMVNDGGGGGGFRRRLRPAAASCFLLAGPQREEKLKIWGGTLKSKTRKKARRK